MLANHKGEIPVFILLVPFITGILFGISILPAINIQWLTGLFIIISFVFIAFNVAYNKLRLYRSRWTGGFLIMLTGFLFGWIITINNNELNADNHFSKVDGQSLIVQVNNEPILKNGLIRFTADVKERLSNKSVQQTTGTILIAISDSTARVQYGDQLIIPAKYNPVDPPFVPAQFNYKKYLGYQNIFYQAYLYPKQYRLISSNQGNPLIAHALHFRKSLVDKLKLNMGDTDAIAVASTLILGYKADLSNDVLQAYSKTGTVHVLSVSGAHVAIVYILLNFSLSFLNGYKAGRVFKAILIITLIWYYSMLTGFSPAVCRAALMISFFIAGKTFNRHINTLNLMSVSALILLIYDPYFIADAGFQLSYLAVFGLIIFQPVVYKWFKFKNKLADKLWALCSVSLAAQVITFPLSAFYFHQFPVYFLISNLFIIFPSAIIMYSGFAYLLLPQTPYLSKFLAAVLENTIIIMNKCLLFVEHLPFAVIGKLWLYTYEYILLYVIIFCLFYFLYDKKRWLLKTIIISCLILSISISMKYYGVLVSNNIAWLNLGRHQGVIFKHGNEAVVLTDLHAGDKAYQYAIQPYLDSCKITNATVADFTGNIKTDWLYKKGNLLQLQNQLVLVLSNNPYGMLSEKLKTDYIYMSGKNGLNLSRINKNFICKTLISNSTMSNKNINNLKEEALLLNINYTSLKRNKSLITVSN